MIVCCFVMLRIKELNFRWGYFSSRKLNTTLNDGGFNLNIDYIYLWS